jgi:hypothetical protein
MHAQSLNSDGNHGEDEKVCKARIYALCEEGQSQIKLEISVEMNLSNKLRAKIESDSQINY